MATSAATDAATDVATDVAMHLAAHEAQHNAMHEAKHAAMHLATAPRTPRLRANTAARASRRNSTPISCGYWPDTAPKPTW